MAGAATTYFTQQRNRYQQLVEQAQPAVAKLEAANQALALNVYAGTGCVIAAGTAKILFWDNFGWSY